MDLSGKVIVVTGAFGNLGRAVAAAAARAGAKLAMLDVETAPSHPLPPELSEALVLGGVDLTSCEATVQAMSAVAKHFGRLDALANVAGGFRWEPLESGDLATWDLLFKLNVKTAAIASRAALPHLLECGGNRIVNVGAGAAIKAAAGMGPYAAAKAGVARLTEALAEEVKDRGITVNAVLPSIIDTPQNRKSMPNAEFHRWVSVQALAEVILFLFSAASEAITGALIPVSGKV